MTSTGLKHDGKNPAGAPSTLYSHNVRIDERLFDLWANARGFTCRNGSHVPGLLYHHALAELLGDRAPQCFGTVRHRNFGMSIAFYSPFDLDALRRPSRGRGTADIENSMKFNRVFCVPAPTFQPGERIAFLVRLRPDAGLGAHPAVYRATGEDGALIARGDEGAVTLAYHRELGSILADCGVLVASELVEYEYALFCDDGIACEKPSKWLPTIQLRCEFDISDPARFYELMLTGIGGSRDHGYGMLRVSVEWRRPIVASA